MIGDGYVGKSSIIKRFIGEEFSEDYEASFSSSFYKAVVDVDITKEVELVIYDTPGAEQFRGLIPIYLPHSLCIIFCFDVSSKKSF